MVERIDTVSVFALLVANALSTVSAFISVTAAAVFLDSRGYADWVALSSVAFLSAPFGAAVQLVTVRRTVATEADLVSHIWYFRAQMAWGVALIPPIGLTLATTFDLPLLGVLATLFLLPVGMLQGVLFGWLQAKSKFLMLMYLATVLAISRPLSLFLSLVWQPNSVDTAAFSQVISSLLLIIVACTFIHPWHHSRRVHLSTAPMFSLASHLPVVCIITILTTSDVLASRLFLAEDQLALYATGSLVAKAITVTPMAATSVFLPKMFDPRGSFVNRVKRFSTILIFSAAAINLGFRLVLELDLSSVYGLSPWGLFEFSVLGVAFALLSHVGYEAVAQSAQRASLGLGGAACFLVVALFLGQPTSAFGLVAIYAISAIFGTVLLLARILKPLEVYEAQR